MSDNPRPTNPPEERPDPHETLASVVGRKEERRAKGRRESHKNVWFGRGMIVMIVWAVVVPTLILVALGVWLDRIWPGPPSWTLMLLFLGVAMGCANAWFWVVREREKLP